MVDSVSAETRIKELLEESRNCTYPEDPTGIKQRYKDTALILFRQYQEENNPKNYLSFGTRRSSSVSQYGNTPIVVRRSRSSNGELSTVVEQVTSIRGRSSISDYTLVETGEKDEEDSETEDELDTTKIGNNIGESESVAESESIDPNDSSKLEDNGKHIDENEISEKSEFDYKTESPLLQKDDKGINGLQVQEAENRKSFSHYDLPLQRRKDNGEVETKGHKVEKKEQEESGRVEAQDDELMLETDSLGDKNKDTVGHEERMVLNRRQDSEGHSFSHERKDSLSSKETRDDKVKVYHQASDSKKSIETNESQGFGKIPKSQNSEIDHEAVLRDYVQKSSCVNKEVLEEQNKACQSNSFNEKSPNDFTFVELKIVEPSDNPLKQADTNNGEKSLTADILNFDDDDDDVMFIDASSPILSRDKSKCESHIAFSQELHQVEDSTPTPPKYQAKSHAESSSPLLQIAPKRESLEYLKGDSIEDVDRAIELENHSGFLDLPVRSPTPPKKSPRSPRTPKRKDKRKQRNSSLVLPSDEDIQESIPKGTRSASPISKVKDTRFFSFSLKREKSKSASSLSSKRGKDRDKICALKFREEDPGVINPVIVKDLKVDGQLETFGKRVGVRSMVIDGTIKRNFIVIHPSDDSETIGLAPLSSTVIDKGHSTNNTSTALSSVKSHIAEVKSDKLESVKRISCTGDLKEDLSDVSKNDAGSLNLSYLSRSLRSKKSKKNSEHKVLESSQSLSSEPTNSSVTDSQILLKSPLALSEDCDSLDDSAQQLDNDTSRTISKLCAIM
ncbi:uncharacterized protein [Panulirus ornatus]|uniref:uncharacterized protein n=1 Tax=Panulirus ornatus TaxID=150431 RepID=UPI003A8B95B0